MYWRCVLEVVLFLVLWNWVTWNWFIPKCLERFACASNSRNRLESLEPKSMELDSAKKEEYSNTNREGSVITELNSLFRVTYRIKWAGKSDGFKTVDVICLIYRRVSSEITNSLRHTMQLLSQNEEKMLSSGTVLEQDNSTIHVHITESMWCRKQILCSMTIRIRWITPQL